MNKSEIKQWGEYKKEVEKKNDEIYAAHSEHRIKLAEGMEEQGKKEKDFHERMVKGVKRRNQKKIDDYFRLSWLKRLFTDEPCMEHEPWYHPSFRFPNMTFPITVSATYEGFLDYQLNQLET